MEAINIWAPPTVSAESVSARINAWMTQNPSKPPFVRFLQDCISSEWPVFWHLKTKHALLLDHEARMSVARQPAEEVDTCSICFSALDAGTEKLDCKHVFHTMCLHKWYRYQTTCPLCRAPSR